jgi:2'-5' RNA ligase
MSFFIAATIPSRVHSVLEAAIKNHAEYVETVVPTEQWHLTLLWLGHLTKEQLPLAELTKPVQQAFMPTVALTHVGRGRARSQLWAWAQPTPALTNLHEALRTRAEILDIPLAKPQRSFVPHIHVADFFNVVQGMGVPDHAATATFAPRCLQLLRSEQGTYFVEGIIPLA